MNPTTPAPRLRRRGRAVAAAALALTVGVAPLAVAQEAQQETPTVSTTAREASRQLDVFDLRGRSFDEENKLQLRNGVPRPFEVRVTDVDQDPDREIHVQASMNNLHRVEGGGHSAGDRIPSEDVELSFSSSPVSAGALTVDLSLEALLDTIDDVTSATLCDEGDGLLGLIGAITGPICDAVDELVDALATTTLPVELPIDQLDLSDLPILDFGFLDTGEGGAFTNADCSTGIGRDFAEFCTGEATTLAALTGTPPALADIQDLLDEALGLEELEDLTLVSLEGDEALFSLTELLDALSAVEGSLSIVVDELLTTLAALDPDDQVELLNDLLEVTDILLGELESIGGRYSSYPSLEVDTSRAPRGGEYEGTLVVTMVE